MTKKKKHKFISNFILSKFYAVLTGVMIVSFLLAVGFVFAFEPLNPTTYVEGKTQVLSYIAAKSNPNAYRILALISFLIGFICLIIIVIPIISIIIKSKRKELCDVSITNEIQVTERRFDNLNDIKKFVDFIYYQLLDQKQKKLASELLDFSKTFYTTSSEYLGEYRILLHKIINQKDISLDDDTKKSIVEQIEAVDKAFGNKLKGV